MNKFAAVMMLVSAALAADAPKSIPFSLSSENKILKAEHELDGVKTKEAQMQMEYRGLQDRVKTLQDDFTKTLEEEKKAGKAVEDAVEGAWKESGLDKSKYDADTADFTFKPKPEGKPAEVKK